MPALREKFNVLRFDTRGHGKSDVPSGLYTLEDLADDAYVLMQSLNIKQAHWIGLSLGSLIGQVFALHHAGILQSLTLAGTTSRYPEAAQQAFKERIASVRAHGLEPLVKPTLARWFTAPFHAAHPDIVEKIGAGILATPVEGYAGCCNAVAQINTTDKLKNIACPTLIIAGTEDAGTTPAMARAMYLATPGAELALLPKAAHLSNIERADLFTPLLLGFLSAN